MFTSIWLFFANGGITGLAREAMTLSLEVYGELVFLSSFKFFIQIFSPFFLFMGSLFCWWMAIREWASYYLNRKLFVSYLFFALIPLVSTIGIFILGARTLFGLTAAHGVEKGMQVFASDMNQFTENVQRELVVLSSQESFIPGINQKVEEILSRNQLRDFTGKYFPGFKTHVFFQSTQAGQPWMFLNSPNRKELLVLPSDELYSSILPDWLSEREYSGISREHGKLFIKSFRYFEADQFRFVVQASLPFDSFLLNKLQERLSVNLTLEGLNDPWRIEPERMESKWYVRFFLMPLQSIWMVEILDWETGHNGIGAQMVFDVAPHLFTTGSDEGLSDVFLGNNQMRIQFAFIIFIIGILILGEIFALVFGIVLIGYITRSLDILATGNDIVAQGQLSYRLPKMGKDQLGAMANSFNAMVSNIQNLLEQSKEKEKLQEELRIAREIQMSLLPSLDGHCLGQNLDAVCIPAKEVGGDYFEILEPGNGKSGILVADVSGKGTSAAFYMAEMKGILLALKPLWNSPIELITELNSLLFHALKSNIFISAIYALLDPELHTVELVRAGHCPAIVVRLDKEPEIVQPQGMALGLATQIKFNSVIESMLVHLAPGEKIILYTDGLDEMISGREMYGVNRLVEKAFEYRRHSPSALKEAILNDVKDFIKAGEQSDDLTLVVVQMPEERSHLS